MDDDGGHKQVLEDHAKDLEFCFKSKGMEMEPFNKGVTRSGVQETS